MKLHIVLGKFGTGAGTIAGELRKALVIKNNSVDAVTRLKFGEYYKDTLVIKEKVAAYADYKQRIDRVANLNSQVKDIIVSGPLALNNINDLIRDYTGTVLYLVNRDSNEENEIQSDTHFETNKIFYETREIFNELKVDAATRYDAFCSAKESTYSINSKFVAFKTFYYDPITQQVKVIPAINSDLSYIRKVAIINT
jgi:hypothetical protein